MAVRGFKGLLVWQKSIDLIEEVYRLTHSFPKHEIYGLSSQMQRAAVSVAANIAEGNGRNSTREYIHHLAISLGSLAEVETFLVVGQRLSYSQQHAMERVEAKCDEIGKMVRGLQKALRSKLHHDGDGAPAP